MTTVGAWREGGVRFLTNGGGPPAKLSAANTPPISTIDAAMRKCSLIGMPDAAAAAPRPAPVSPPTLYPAWKRDMTLCPSRL